MPLALLRVFYVVGYPTRNFAFIALHALYRHFMPLHAALKFTPFHFILRIITLYYFLTALLLHNNSLFSSSPVYLTKLNFNSFLNSFGELSINN